MADAAAGAAAARNWLMMQPAGRFSGKQQPHGKKTFLPAFHPFLSHHVFLFHIVNFVFMFTSL